MKIKISTSGFEIATIGFAFVMSLIFAAIVLLAIIALICYYCIK